jgi:hypothetical protein
MASAPSPRPPRLHTSTFYQEVIMTRLEQPTLRRTVLGRARTATRDLMGGMHTEINVFDSRAWAG